MPQHKPFTEEELAPILEDFYKNGATIIRNILSREECEQICSRVDQIFAEPYLSPSASGPISTITCPITSSKTPTNASCAFSANTLKWPMDKPHP